MISVTELDFFQIKQNIIDHLKGLTDESGNLVYKDYDFAGSGINTLIDVLAYNTHYNAMTAHFAINETFIDGAQLRSSVVSAAKLLGYVPRSNTSSRAVVDLRFSRAANVTDSSFFLDRDTIFKITDRARDRAYYYTLRDGVNMVYEESSNEYVASDVSIYEGRRISRRYQVSGAAAEERYVIDDIDIDTESLIVRVYPNFNDTLNPEIYKRYESISEVNETSAVYFINENSLGNYEISFGNGIFGKKLTPTSVIEVEYVVTAGSPANGLRDGFQYLSSSSPVEQLTRVQRVLTKYASEGGGLKESADLIRTNATASFVSQNRAVTVDDYKSLIYRTMPAAESVSVWGGEYNDPPQYGKVFISINKSGDVGSDENPTLTAKEKQDLIDSIKTKNVLTITPEIVDPEYIDIILDVLVNYNPNLVQRSNVQLENDIRENVISVYNANRLNSFEKIFRYSNFTQAVDGYLPAILNCHVRVFVSKTFTINPDIGAGRNAVTTLRYGTELTIDDGRAVASYATNIPWKYRDIRMYLGESSTSNPNIIRLNMYALNADGVKTVINSNIGEINLSTGVVTIDTANLSDAPLELSLDLIPVSNDVVSKRNQLIRIDVQRCNVVASPDLSSGGINYTPFRRDR